MSKTPFPLKIENDTLSAIRQKATEQNRSASNYIETLLKDHVEANKIAEAAEGLNVVDIMHRMTYNQQKPMEVYLVITGEYEPENFDVMAYSIKAFSTEDKAVSYALELVEEGEADYGKEEHTQSNTADFIRFWNIDGQLPVVGIQKHEISV